MSKDKISNIEASIRARLQNLARERHEEFGSVLGRYGIERLLHRLAHSEFADRFVVKGATVFALWTGEPHRPTRDLDLLGFGASGVSDLESVFRSLCADDASGDPPDGLRFLAESVSGAMIKEDQEYEGVRVTMLAVLGRARIPLQVDIGFGDAVFPAPSDVEFPTLLGMPALVLRAYPREAVVAEKLQAMTALGIANSRMKDFFDLWLLGREFGFDGAVLSEAIRRTFERRRTAIPAEAPLALTQAFSDDRGKQTQWNAFLKKSGLLAEAPPLGAVIEYLGAFLLPPLLKGATGTFSATWPPGGPWTPTTGGTTPTSRRRSA